MKFDFDPHKSQTNESKHGVSFDEIKKLWATTAVEIQARTVDEPRFMIIGKLNEKFYSCIYTVRGHTIRLISARRSRKTEEKIYHDHFKA